MCALKREITEEREGGRERTEKSGGLLPKPGHRRVRLYTDGNHTHKVTTYKFAAIAWLWRKARRASVKAREMERWKERRLGNKEKCVRSCDALFSLSMTPLSLNFSTYMMHYELKVIV